MHGNTKLTVEELTMCLKFRHVRTMKQLVCFYCYDVCERTLYRVLKKAIKAKRVRINKAYWPYHYEAI